VGAREISQKWLQKQNTGVENVWQSLSEFRKKGFHEE